MTVQLFDNATGDTRLHRIGFGGTWYVLEWLAAHNICGTDLEGIGVQGSNGISIYGLNLVSTGLTLEKATRLGFNAAVTEVTDNQKPEFIEHGNFPVTLKIVYDKDSRRVLGAQMAARERYFIGYPPLLIGNPRRCFNNRKLALTKTCSSCTFNKPYNYITVAALGAE